MEDSSTPQKRWLAKYAENISIPVSKPKVKIIRRGILLVLVMLIVLSLSLNPGTAAHKVSYYTPIDKIENTFNELSGKEYLNRESLNADEWYSYESGAALRGQITFAELSAGCVAETQWLLPLEKGRPIVPIRNYSSEEDIIAEYKEGYPRIDDESDYEYANRLIDERIKKIGYPTNINWYSYPPVRGNYVATDWEGKRIITELKQGERPMRFEEGLRLLNQGNYVIWYHPSMLEDSEFEFAELQDYVFNKIVLESNGSPKIYLVPLIGSNLEDYPRKIYLSRLNYTQSCVSFNEKIIDKFYSY